MSGEPGIPPESSSNRGPRRARFAALGWGLFMLLLTSWPRLPEVPYLSNVPNVDRFVHFGLYAVEGFLLYLGIAWPGRRRFSLARVAALAGLMAVWAVADEVHQAWIPGRSTEAGDVAADVLGATAGAAAASALVGRRRTGTLAETGRETIRPRAGG